VAFRQISLDKVDSTQSYLREYIYKNSYVSPLVVVANEQTYGLASGANSWIGVRGNLFFSFVISIDKLSKDLPIQSSSIYFSCLLQDIFRSLGSKCYIKWPNDFYIKNKKIGGTMTKISSNLLYCGIGINIYRPNSSFGKLDIDIDKEDIIHKFTTIVEKKISWQSCFKKFKIQYTNNCENYQTTINSKIISLRQDMLQYDGSLLINNKKEYSLR
jgi:BirA family biotin operon repressor/biotin-[acetyl-CoA-carboxylase] ligase